MKTREAMVIDYLRKARLEVLEEQVAIAEIPCRDYRADERAARLMRAWQREGLRPRRDKVGNVVAVRKGLSTSLKALSLSEGNVPATKPTLVLCAHIDSVFYGVEKIKVRRRGNKLFAPGICDDASGVANLILLARAMRKSGVETAGDVVFVGSVGEESCGRIWGMEHFWRKARWARPYFVAVDGATPGKIVLVGLSSWSPTVKVTGPGGHSFANFGRPNPIHMIARLVAKATTMKADRSKDAIYNANLVSGGTAVNVIPEHASVTLNLRSSDARELVRMKKRVEKFIREARAEELRWATSKKRLAVEMTAKGRKGGRTQAKHELVKAAVAAMKKEGLRPKFDVSSTDANMPLSLGIPAITIPAGGTCGNIHSLEEWHDTAGRTKELAALARLVFSVVG